MSAHQYPHVSFESANGQHHPQNHAATPNPGVDWMGYPELFSRVAPQQNAESRSPAEPATVNRVASHNRVNAAARPTTNEVRTQPAPIIGEAGGLLEAFLGYCQAALFAGGTYTRPDLPSEAREADRVIAAAEAFGFSREELRRLGCGLYTGPAAVNDHLQSVGFAESAVRESRLTVDENARPRTEWQGRLIVPLTDASGKLRDLLCVAVDSRGVFANRTFWKGGEASELLVYGMATAWPGLQSISAFSRSGLVFVEDVLDGLLLQTRGIMNVVALGGTGDSLSPRRWEQLYHAGVRSVTLAFRRNERHGLSIRDALVNALRAKCAPEVFVANPYPAGEETPVGVLRRFGSEACTAAFAARSLAFHNKNFGGAQPVNAALNAHQVPPTAPRMETAPVREPEPRFATAAPVNAKPVTVEPVLAPFTSNPTPATARPPVEASPVAKSPVEASPAHAPAEPHHRAAYRAHVAELLAALPREEQELARNGLTAFEQAIGARNLWNAAWLIGAAEEPWFTVGPWAPSAEWMGHWGQFGAFTPAMWRNHPGMNGADLLRGWQDAEQVHALRSYASRANRSGEVSSASSVIDRLVHDAAANNLPAHLEGFERQADSQSVAWIVDPTPAGRLHSLCDRLLTALEQRADRSFVVVCDEHTERQVMLSLITLLTTRISEGPGLTIDEVEARLSKTVERSGYRDKPWLADEAADRLRLWSSRLIFVSCPAGPEGRDRLEAAMATARNSAPVGGIYCDGFALPLWFSREEFGLPMLREAMPYEWSMVFAGFAGSRLIERFAAQQNCPVTLTSPVTPQSPSPMPMPVSMPMPVPVTGIAAANGFAATGWPMFNTAGWNGYFATMNERGSLPFFPSLAPLARTQSGRELLAVLKDWLRRECDSANS